jgi:hypothetical protein
MAINKIDQLKLVLQINLVEQGVGTADGGARLRLARSHLGL